MRRHQRLGCLLRRRKALPECAPVVDAPECAIVCLEYAVGIGFAQVEVAPRPDPPDFELEPSSLKSGQPWSRSTNLSKSDRPKPIRPDFDPICVDIDKTSALFWRTWCGFGQASGDFDRLWLERDQIVGDFDLVGPDFGHFGLDSTGMLLHACREGMFPERAPRVHAKLGS